MNGKLVCRIYIKVTGRDSLQIWVGDGDLVLYPDRVGFSSVTSIPTGANITPDPFQQEMIGTLKGFANPEASEAFVELVDPHGLSRQGNSICRDVVVAAEAIVDQRKLENAAQALIDTANAHGKLHGEARYNSLDNFRFVHRILFSSVQEYQGLTPEFLGMQTDTKSHERAITVYFGGWRTSGQTVDGLMPELKKSKRTGWGGHCGEPINGRYRLAEGATLKEAAREILGEMHELARDPQRFLMPQERYDQTMEVLLLRPVSTAPEAELPAARQ